MTNVFQPTPGVQIQEQDFTNGVPTVSTPAAAIVADFQWGPVGVPQLLGSETDLVNIFHGPVDRNAGDWFAAKNFLAYANALYGLRVVDSTSAVANALSVAGPYTDSSTSQSVAKVQVDNVDDFNSQRVTLAAITGANTEKLNFIARYPGSDGNNISISYADSAAFPTWAYNNYFEYAPATGQACFVILVSGTVSETFTVSLIAGTVDQNNQPNFIDVVINGQSGLIYVLNENLVQYNGTGDPLPLSSGDTPISLVSGADTTTGPGLDSAMIAGWNTIAGTNDISLRYCLQGGDKGVAIVEAMVQDCAEIRKDCVGFVSPPYASVVGLSTPLTSILEYFNTALNLHSSYAFADGNYKYQYDYYNSKYRWVPLNGDIAGLCAQRAANEGAWNSPAGYDAVIKNIVKLAFNPNDTQQGSLYSSGINPVVAFPGQGTVLWGDKTLLNTPSAFSRINVRNLFIEVEQSIAVAAKQNLFKLNNTFTQTRFQQLVVPYLRSIQGSGGIQRVNGKDGFIVVCDSTVNTPTVVDNNQFVALIAMKPARSINWVTLKFAAVDTNVDFQEFLGLYVNQS